MAIRLEDKNREYKRIRQSAKEKAQLARAGFQHVLSSNVSAIAQSGKDLVIRFHGGATYQYRNAGKLFEQMLNSNSKGSFVWKKLIRPKVPYQKIGGVKLQSDEQFTDKDLMNVSQAPSKKPILPTLITIKSLEGIIVTESVAKDILVTNAIS